jgi:predicted AlkP superfamily phosphohydrolase/phosphomutase
MSIRKTLVLSIDSGCWEYLDPLINEGRMPNVARLIERGVRGVLESTMPPITPVAFSSFITGTNPGKHGVFDWTVRGANGQAQSVNAAVRRGAPFWRYLNRAGVRVGVFNIPLTYPVQPMDGFLVPGIPAPSQASDLTHPSAALGQIEEHYKPYQVDVPNALVAEGAESYCAAWLAHEEKQTDAAMALMEAYDVDVLAFNYASLDRLNHFSPQWDHLEAALVNVDAQVGRFVARYPDANVILMSDHGSRRVTSAFLLGKWLAQNGYAVYGEKSLDIPKHEINFALARYFRAREMNGAGEKIARRLLSTFLAVTPLALRRLIWERMYEVEPGAFDYRFAERLDWERTTAFATSNSGPLFLNRTASANGHTRDYDSLREDLIQALRAVEDPATGERVFSRVHRREEIYHGPALAEAPDLVVDHYDSTCDLIVDNNPGGFCFVNRLNRFGDHSRDGIFVLSGPDFAQRGEEDLRASIIDLPATLLHLYDVPIPDDFDGRVLGEHLVEGFRSAHPIRTQAASEEAPAPTSTDYGEADEEEVVARLRDLGYL